MAKGDKLIADSCLASRKKLIRNHLAVRRNLYAKAVSAGDYRAALAIKRDEAELLGLYPVKVAALEAVKPPVDRLQSMSDDELDAELLRCQRQLAECPTLA